MCGIAGFYVKDSYQDGEYDLEKLTDGLLLGIEERGQDATGIFTATRGGESFDLFKDDIPATYFVQLRDFLPKNIRMALLHTRLATQGKPSKNENNHPVNFRSCFATHNGVIYNERQIINETGEKRPAEVDSIAVPMLIATCGFDKALENLPKLQGSWALAIADPVTNPDELLLVRGISSPLVILDHPKMVVWASTHKAIVAAWEYAIGTAPDTQKFDWLQEGEATLLGPESQDANVLPFMTIEPWWKKDEEMDTMVYGTTGGWRDASACSVTPTYGSEKVLCFECGERTAYFHITESYTESDGKYIEFDVPVCYKCEQELDADPKNLTYRYATSKVKIRCITPGQMCYWCVRHPAIRFDKAGDAVCETCNIGDSQVGSAMKHQGTFRGGDDDKFFTLNPGDAIPEEMKYAFNGCESCGSTAVDFVGADGFVICDTCHTGEKVVASIDDELVLSQCEVCDCSVLEESLKLTMYGMACRACRYGKEEAAEIARAVVIPQRCDMCNGETDYLIRKDSMWMCRECKSDYGVELDCGHTVVGVGLAHDVRTDNGTLVVCANCLPEPSKSDPDSISKWAKLFRKGARA